MRKHPSQHAAALLLVLWAIAVVSFAVLWVAGMVHLDLQAGASDAALLRARQIALTGVALGLHPQVSRDDMALLNQQFEDGSRLEVRLAGEGARLNINRILLGGDRVPLKNLFILWGLNNDEADALIDRLTDWVDGDDFRLLNGAESAEYLAAGITDAPANRPFRSVEEMARVSGMDKLGETHPGWRDAFTIFGDGKIDVNEASSEVIQAATGLAPEMVEGIIRQRAGPDGIEPSEDDFRFEQLDQLNGWLQSSSQPYREVVRRLSVDSPVKRIDSRGIVGNVERKISVVTQSGQGGQSSANYLLWEEK